MMLEQLHASNVDDNCKQGDMFCCLLQNMSKQKYLHILEDRIEDKLILNFQFFLFFLNGTYGLLHGARQHLLQGL